MPRIFSGWRNQNSPVVAAVKPIFWWTSCSFHGSPTQNASMLPTFMLATICGGGTTIRSTRRCSGRYRRRRASSGSTDRACRPGRSWRRSRPCRQPSSWRRPPSARQHRAGRWSLYSCGDRDRLAVLVEVEQRVHRQRLLVLHDRAGRIEMDLRTQDVAAVDAVVLAAERHVVARSAPRGLLENLYVRNAVFLVEALLLGDDQRRRIRQRDETELGAGNLRDSWCCIGAVRQESRAVASRAVAAAACFRKVRRVAAGTRGFDAFRSSRLRWWRVGRPAPRLSSSVQNKKLPARPCASASGIAKRNLIGSFACAPAVGREFRDPSVGRNLMKHEACQIRPHRK